MEIDNIYNMDCLEGMKLIPDGSIDLIVTDPPYEFKDTTGAGAFGTCRGESESKKGRTYLTREKPDTVSGHQPNTVSDHQPDTVLTSLPD